MENLVLNKKLQLSHYNIFFIIVLIAIIPLFFYINGFVKATVGWFAPSYTSVLITLISCIFLSFFFVIISSRFKILNAFYLFSSLSLILGYIGFILLKPSANMLDSSGFLLSLMYLYFGKYLIYILGIIAVIKVLLETQKSFIRIMLYLLLVIIILLLIFPFVLIWH